MKYGRLGWLGALVLFAGCSSKLDVVPGGAAGSSPAAGSPGVSGGAGLPGASGSPGAAGSPVDIGGGPNGGTAGIGGAGDPVLGHDCAPQTTAHEAAGTPAATDVIAPAHCEPGLTCGAEGKCVEIPSCPQASGDCIVRGIDGGAGGASGGGGASNSVAGIGPGTTKQQPTITGLTADDTQLYWIEYGTRDSLGNYRGDGKIFAQALAGGAKTALASTLPGPLALAVTDGYAYVETDGGQLVGSPNHPQLLRVPLGGGAPELVQDNLPPGALLGAGDRAFWTDADGRVLTQLALAGAAHNVFLEGPLAVRQMQSDGAALFVGDNQSIRMAPLSGDPSSSTGLSDLPFSLKGDAIFGLESIDNGAGTLLDSAAKTASTWQRARALGAGAGESLQIVGDRLFWTASPASQYGSRVVRTTTFDSSSAVVQLLETSARQYDDPFRWVGSATALYWTDGAGVYSRSLTDLP